MYQFSHYSDTTGHHMWDDSMGGLGILWMLLWLAIIVVAVVGLVRWLGSPDKTKGGETPLEIAKKRYAKGEIDEKEYKKLVKDLKE